MNKTKIEWCDYTINPVKGLCPMACPYCYSRAMYKRFKWNPEIRCEIGNELDILWRHPPKDGSRIFVGSTMELFGDWIQPYWLSNIFAQCKQYPKLTFIFLTKQPQNLIKWSPFPDNCWVGVSATSKQMMWDGLWDGLMDVKASVKFISFEPLLSWENLSHWTEKSQNIGVSDLLRSSGINWVIIGQQTPAKRTTMPRIEWIKSIVESCDREKIPVFLKNNLATAHVIVRTKEQSERETFQETFKWALDKSGMKLRQEFPRS